MGAPRPTIEDVARASHVSVATVSRALRGLPNVASATRARVEEVARELRYEIDPKASSLASGRTMTIGVVAPLFGTWYADEVVTGAESVLADARYDMLIASVHDVDTLDAFLARTRSFGRRIDGALLIDVFMDPERLALLDDLDVPIVAVGEELGTIPSVTIDNVAAGATAVRHLAELGHRRIGVMGGPPPRTFISPVSARREAGWRAVLEEIGVDASPELISDGFYTASGGADAMRRLLDLADPPTAVFCMSDRMALGAMMAARERGLDVPDDMSLVGFDDDELAATFGLTTMRQPVAEIGAVAAGMLLSAVADRDTVVAGTVVDVDLVVRSTTAPPPGG
ncbi:MAG: LacI family DNA-binding transcriptional regulator [Actinomycetota bacterium]